MSRLIVLLAVIAATGPLSAQEINAASPEAAPKSAAIGEHVNKILAANFAISDQNHDGKLTAAEAKGNMPVVEQEFAEIDTAKSGVLTLGQIQAYFAARRAERQAKRAKHMEKSATAPAKSATPKP